MPNIYSEKGSLQDAAAAFKVDLDDTFNNQCDFYNALLTAENSNGAIHRNFALNDCQYFIDKSADSQVYRIYNSDPSLNDPVAVIDEDNPENTYGYWSDLDALEISVNDACDCTYLMQQLCQLSINAIDGATNIANQLTSQVGSWISQAGPSAKECYNDIVNTLKAGDDGSVTALAWIQNQYNLLANAQANDTDNTFSFSSTSFHVQGFAGSYALRTVFAAASTVLSAVMTVIQPIIGITIGILTGLFNALLGLIPNASETKVVEKDAANNIFAVPLFQDEIAWDTVAGTLSRIYCRLTEDGTPIYLDQALSQASVATLRMPGLVWTFYKTPNNTLQYECFVSCDLNKYNDFYYSYRYYTSSEPDKAFKDKNPYILRIDKSWLVMDGNSHPYGILDHPLSHVDSRTIYYSLMNNCMAPGGSGNFADQIDLSLGNSQDPIESDDALNYFDNCVRSSILVRLMTIMNGFAYDAYGSSYSFNYGSGDISIPQAGATSVDWSLYFNKKMYWVNQYYDDGLSEQDHSISWSNFVNKIFPRIRQTWKGSTRPLTWLANESTTYDNATGYGSLMIYPGIVSSKKYHLYPPKYGNNARAITIGIAAGAAVAVAAFAVTKTALKISQRKKQVSRYVDVQNKFDELKADPTNSAKIKAYRKSIRKYNRWCSFTGTSRLSAISGWETGSSDTILSQPTSLTGTLRQQYSDAVSSKNESVDDISTLILRSIVG